jgi:hypothetical protein
MRATSLASSRAPGPRPESLFEAAIRLLKSIEIDSSGILSDSNKMPQLLQWVLEREFWFVPPDQAFSRCHPAPWVREPISSVSGDRADAQTQVDRC